MITLTDLYLAAQKFSIHANQDEYKHLHLVVLPKLLSLYMDAKGRVKLFSNGHPNTFNSRFKKKGELISDKGWYAQIWKYKGCYFVTGCDADFITFDLDVAKEHQNKAVQYANKGW